MLRLSNERARWIKHNVLPHEYTIRVWLRQQAVYDLEIDDIIQEMYARFVALESVSGIHDPKNYAFRTAYSIVASHVRHARVVPIRSADDFDYLYAAAPERNPEEVLDFQEQLRDVNAVLNTLPRLCRKAFLLRRLEGYSQSETARKLNISEKTVEKYMTRALKLLMDTYGRGGKSTVRASSYGPKKSASHGE